MASSTSAADKRWTGPFLFDSFTFTYTYQQQEPSTRDQVSHNIGGTLVMTFWGIPPGGDVGSSRGGHGPAYGGRWQQHEPAAPDLHGLGFCDAGGGPRVEPVVRRSSRHAPACCRVQSAGDQPHRVGHGEAARALLLRPGRRSGPLSVSSQCSMPFLPVVLQFLKASVEVHGDCALGRNVELETTLSVITACCEWLSPSRLAWE